MAEGGADPGAAAGGSGGRLGVGRGARHVAGQLLEGFGSGQQPQLPDGGQGDGEDLVAAGHAERTGERGREREPAGADPHRDQPGLPSPWVSRFG